MYAVIFLPESRLQSVLRHQPELRSKPVVLVEKEDAKSMILERNRVARNFDITGTMSVVQALARCSELVVLRRSPKQEEAVRDSLLEIAFGLSPEVELTSDGCCTIDLRHGRVDAWDVLGKGILEHLAALDLFGRIGIAPNPDLAFLAARKASPILQVQSPMVFLSQLAISEIDPPHHLLAILKDWGVHTLGQLTSLPRPNLSSRLGPEADWLWQRAMGNTQRLLRVVRPHEELSESFDFEREIETLEPLLFILRRFLDQLVLRLNGINHVAGKMILKLPLENDGEYHREFSIPAPTAERAVLFRILDTHLESLHLEPRPMGCHLRVVPVRPDQQQMRFFENPLRDVNGFGETLARLTALLGEGNVGVAVLENTHQPDRFRLNPPTFEKVEDEESDEKDLSLGLPLRRYRPAMPARVRVVHHIPSFVVSDKAHGTVTGAHGPYRGSSAWWDQGHWRIEEWDVEIAGCGIFRLSLQQNDWFVEGCYEAALH